MAHAATATVRSGAAKAAAWVATKSSSAARRTLPPPNCFHVRSRYASASSDSPTPRSQRRSDSTSLR